MDRFIAYWHIDHEHCNVPVTEVVVTDDLVILKRDDKIIGQFDRGFVDGWYITGARE